MVDFRVWEFSFYFLFDGLRVSLTSSLSRCLRTMVNFAISLGGIIDSKSLVFSRLVVWSVNISSALASSWHMMMSSYLDVLPGPKMLGLQFSPRRIPDPTGEISV